MSKVYRNRFREPFYHHKAWQNAVDIQNQPLCHFFNQHDSYLDRHADAASGKSLEIQA